ncbi:ABC transporter ATP-binding protein [Endozoicomonadaceae bacterium StTr2]
MAEVKLNGISKSYDQGKTWIIKDVNLEIHNGEFVAFIGPSGCGKSTLLRMICGLEDITTGEMHIDGELINDHPPHERQVGMVFQSYALYPHMTVAENMAFGLKLARADKSIIKQRVDEAARMLQLEPLLERKPKAMSGGQRQRVAIGRSIVQEPRVFLFDEPLSNLDVALRVQMRQELSRLHRRLKTTSIYVTHDQVEAMTLANRIVVLSPLQPGAKTNLEQVGGPLELYHHPANLFVAGFIGSPKMNFLNAELQQPGDEWSTIKLTSGEVLKVAANTSSSACGSQVIIGIRPEHVLLLPDKKQDQTEKDNTVIATVSTLERLGSESFIYLDHDSVREYLIVRVTGSGLQNENDKLGIHLPPKQCHLFSAEGLAFSRTHQPELNTCQS